MARGPVEGSEGTPLDPAQPKHHHVLVMNHSGDDLSAGVAALRSLGYQVTVSPGAADSTKLLENVRPSVILLNPIVLDPAGIEVEMVAAIQREDDPIPLIVLAEDAKSLAEIARFKNLLFRDFLLKPYQPEEVVQRVSLALLHKDKYLVLQAHTRELEGQVIRDFKTGLYTERYFRQVLRQEFQRAERHRLPLSFLLLDVDDFKQVNDTTDYAFGDEVLRNFAEILRTSVREIDHAARFGGDEFMILLPQTTPSEAVQVAARIRNVIGRKDIVKGKYTVRISVSIGIDTYDGRSMSSPEDLRRHANSALKEAKRRGKNRIWIYSGGIVEDEAAQRPAPGGEQEEGGAPANAGA
jgi:diguanylate cyclase (GGDEF)-like protein